jgi:DNA-binding GntR family transcriptional regulator
LTVYDCADIVPAVKVTYLHKSGAAAGMPTAEHAIETRRSQTLVSICHAELERLILDGDLERGARINELALAARLGVSRGPVREACRSLVQAGLLESHANRGFFVRKLAQKEVVDLYDVRAGLMRLAGGLIAQRATARQITRLQGMVEAMDAACARSDFEGFQQRNVEFHGALVEMSGNRRLLDLHQGLAKELQLYRRRGLMSAAAMKASSREHRAIVEAIASHDAARAAATMENHILQGKARFLAAAGHELEE